MVATEQMILNLALLLVLLHFLRQKIMKTEKIEDFSQMSAAI
ncbi:MAG TPA: hypothetical protein VJ546_04150 [Bacillales bacterium]|nr:hypothetical protein [Bacillales bacterium]